MFEWSGEASLAALFASAFVSATVLPANSEVVLMAVLRAHPGLAAAAIALATLGNTLGGLTTYGLGRLLPKPEKGDSPLFRRFRERDLARVRRYGAWALLAAWVPVVGDALCAAAGWLRVPVVAATAAMAAGKAARYCAVAYAATLL